MSETNWSFEKGDVDFNISNMRKSTFNFTESVDKLNIAMNSQETRTRNQQYMVTIEKKSVSTNQNTNSFWDLTRQESSIAVVSYRKPDDIAIVFDNESQIELKTILLIRKEFHTAENQDIEARLECHVCFTEYPSNKIISCSHCKTRFCSNCLQVYVSNRIRDGDKSIECIGTTCSYRLSKKLICLLVPELKNLYMKNVSESGKKEKKFCPCCNKVEVNKYRKIKMIKCSQCETKWCFQCYSPWHEGMKCKQYKEQNDLKSLERWATNKGNVRRNATKCPKCKFYIEKIEGCNHMTCSKCKSYFCYECGKEYGSSGAIHHVCGEDQPIANTRRLNQPIANTRRLNQPTSNIRKRCKSFSICFSCCFGIIFFAILFVLFLVFYSWRIRRRTMTD